MLSIRKSTQVLFIFVFIAASVGVAARMGAQAAVRPNVAPPNLTTGTPVMATTDATANTAPAVMATPTVGAVGMPVGVNAPMPVLTGDPAEIEGLPGYALVGAERLYLRTGDGADYAPIGVMVYGTPLVVLGRNIAGVADDYSALWWYVRVGDTYGWARSNFLVLRGDLSDVPVVDYRGALYRPTLYIGFNGNLVYAEARLVTPVCAIPGEREYLVVARNEVLTAFRIEAVCEDGRPVTAWINADLGLLRNFGEVEIPVSE